MDIRLSVGARVGGVCGDTNAWPSCFFRGVAVAGWGGNGGLRGFAWWCRTSKLLQQLSVCVEGQKQAGTQRGGDAGREGKPRYGQCATTKARGQQVRRPKLVPWSDRGMDGAMCEPHGAKCEREGAGRQHTLGLQVTELLRPTGLDRRSRRVNSRLDYTIT